MVHGAREGNLFALISTGKIPPPPVSLLLGLKLERALPGTVELSFEAADSFLNPAGQVQGGMLSAMLDEAMGIALLSVLDASEGVVTLEMKTQFLSPAVAGAIRAQGKLIRRTRKIAFVDGELHQGETCIARATATMLVRSALK